MITDTKRRLLSATVALGAVLATTAPAAAQWYGSTTMYHHYYYSDDTYTEEVGQAYDACHPNGVHDGPTQGRATPYVQSYPYGECHNGVPGPRSPY